MKKTKIEKVKEHLYKKGAITSMEAFRLYNATRLSAIVFCLRRKGMNIITETIHTKDGFYGKYILIENIKRKP